MHRIRGVYLLYTESGEPHRELGTGVEANLGLGPKRSEVAGGR